jgi:hypothetical protein
VHYHHLLRFVVNDAPGIALIGVAAFNLVSLFGERVAQSIQLRLFMLAPVGAPRGKDGM